jgi:hypothetical protein
VSRSTWAFVLLVLALCAGLEAGLIRGRAVRDIIGPAVVALCLARIGALLHARRFPGWPRIPLRAWASAWLRFLALVAAFTIAAMTLLAGLLAAWRRAVPWAFATSLFRFFALGVAGAAVLGAVGRLRPPKPPPITSPGAR